MNPLSFPDLLTRRGISVLSRRPPVYVLYERMFEIYPAAMDTAAAGGAVFFLMLGFEHETAEPADTLAAAVTSFLKRHPSCRVCVLANTPAECKVLAARGLETVFCHQNAFLDERRYRILPLKKRYDAVYLARLTPFKRHELIPTDVAASLLLLGCKVNPKEAARVEASRERLASARWIPSFRGLDVSKYVCAARCGLALSAREGAMFASAEYFLCGLPIVNTPSIGGREILFPSAFVRSVDASPEAVGAGIRYWCENPPNPIDVRQAWLELARPHRETFRRELSKAIGRTFRGRLIHKLGIRTPYGGPLFTSVVRGYLLGQAVAARLKGGRLG